jgi:K+ transporter
MRLDGFTFHFVGITAPGLARIVVPITVTILVLLFLVQCRGTEFVGNIFGPVMLVWFLAIGLLGLRGIMHSPDILAAISPYYAVAYLVHSGPAIAFGVLGSAFLALTGAEAMYADMGHFGRRPIRLGYFRRVMVIPTSKPSGMAFWRKPLFATMHLNANLPAVYFGVPATQVVEVGVEVEI